MSRTSISLLCLAVGLALVSAATAANPNATNLAARSVRFGASPPRQGRIFDSIYNLFGGNRIRRGPHKKFYCPSRGCPHWSCQDDSSVIHGYCCGCAHPDDSVPFVTCRPDLRCPLSSEPLCTDYNFMLDCCCTGP